MGKVLHSRIEGPFLTRFYNKFHGVFAAAGNGPANEWKRAMASTMPSVGGTRWWNREEWHEYIRWHLDGGVGTFESRIVRGNGNQHPPPQRPPPLPDVFRAEGSGEGIVVNRRAKPGAAGGGGGVAGSQRPGDAGGGLGGGGARRPSLDSWIESRVAGQKVTGALIASVRRIVCAGAEGHDPAEWATTRVEMAVDADFTLELRRLTYVVEGDYAIGFLLTELLEEVNQSFTLQYPEMEYPNVRSEIAKAATAGYLPPTAAQIAALRKRNSAAVDGAGPAGVGAVLLLAAGGQAGVVGGAVVGGGPGAVAGGDPAVGVGIGGGPPGAVAVGPPPGPPGDAARTAAWVAYAKSLAKPCFDYFQLHVMNHPSIPVYQAISLANPHYMHRARPRSRRSGQMSPRLSVPSLLRRYFKT